MAEVSRSACGGARAPLLQWRSTILAVSLFTAISAVTFAANAAAAQRQTAERTAPTSQVRVRAAKILRAATSAIGHEMKVGEVDAAQTDALVLHPPSAFERWRQTVESQRHTSSLTSAYRSARKLFRDHHTRVPLAVAHWYKTAQTALGDVRDWQLAEVGYLVAKQYGDTRSERATVTFDFNAYRSALASAYADIDVLLGRRPPARKSSIPTTATLPLARKVLLWWEDVKTDFGPVQLAFTILRTAAQKTTVTQMGTACTSLIFDVQRLQGDPPVPTEATNVLWQAALSDYAAGAALCKAGAFARTANELASASTDFTHGTIELAQAGPRIKNLTGGLGP